MKFTKKELAVIAESALFVGLDEKSTLEALEFFGAIKKEFKKNESICEIGEPFFNFGLVLDGIVQVLDYDLQGERVIMANVASGATYGESLCFLEEQSSPVLVTASTDCTVLLLNCKRLRGEGCENPALRERFISMLARRALSMNDRIQILSKLTIRDKLMTYFSQCAKEAGSRTFSLPLDRESLALYLGVNRSALSRELSNMQRDGIIEFYKNSFKIL